MEITDKMIANLLPYLSKKGAFYLFLIAQNKPQNIINNLKSLKFSSEIVAYQQV